MEIQGKRRLTLLRGTFLALAVLLTAVCTKPACGRTRDAWPEPVLIPMSSPPAWATKEKYRLVVPSYEWTMQALQDAVRQIHEQGENFHFGDDFMSRCNPGMRTPVLNGSYSIFEAVMSLTRGSCRVKWLEDARFHGWHEAYFPPPWNTFANVSVNTTRAASRSQDDAASRGEAKLYGGHSVIVRSSLNQRLPTPHTEHLPTQQRQSPSDPCTCEEIRDAIGPFDFRTGRCTELDGSLLPSVGACGVGFIVRGAPPPVNARTQEK